MKHELKHIGPNVEEKILDSWMINGYYIILLYGVTGGLFVKISLNNEIKRSYHTDNTHAVVLIHLNACMCAADRDAINTLPIKPYRIKLKEALKGLLYHETVGWEKYFSQFERFDMDYLEELNEELMRSNLKAVEQIACNEIKNSPAYQELEEIEKLTKEEKKKLMKGKIDQKRDAFM